MLFRSFTRFVLPTETQHPRHRLLHSDLKPKNYLNISDGDTVPFSFCPALGPTDELAIKYDSIALAKTRMHVGSGARMQRVVSRALAGHPVTISVVGGSGEFDALFCAAAYFRERRTPRHLALCPYGPHLPLSIAVRPSRARLFRIGALRWSLTVSRDGHQGLQASARFKQDGSDALRLHAMKAYLDKARI